LLLVTGIKDEIRITAKSKMMDRQTGYKYCLALAFKNGKAVKMI